MRRTYLRQLQDIFHQEQRGLFITALAITREHAAAEDAVQEGLIALSELHTVPNNIKAYLYRVVRNKALLVFRVHSKHAGDSEITNDLIDVDATPADMQILAKQVNKHINLLENNYRQILVMKLYAGLTFEEIAVITDCPLNTVASWYRRGLIQLKELIHGTRQQPGQESGKIASIK